MDKVLEFDFTDGDINRHFVLNADNFRFDYDGSYLDVFYDDAEILEIKDGGAEHFEPTGSTWAGHAYTQRDAIYQSASAFLNDSPEYDFAYAKPELELFKDETVKTACSLNGRNIADKYFHDECAYDLLLVTDKAVYYSFDDAAVMLSAADGSLISDNYFAEEGFMSSIEDILRGDEREIYVPVDLSEVKQSLADDLYIGIDDARESVNINLVDGFDNSVEPSSEYGE